MVITRRYPIERGRTAGTEPGLQAVWHYLVKQLLIQPLICNRSPWIFMVQRWDNGVTQRDNSMDRVLIYPSFYFRITMSAPESDSKSRTRQKNSFVGYKNK
jgi:hypothetical protein